MRSSIIEEPSSKTWSFETWMLFVRLFRYKQPFNNQDEALEFQRNAPEFCFQRPGGEIAPNRRLKAVDTYLRYIAFPIFQKAMANWAKECGIRIVAAGSSPDITNPVDLTYLSDSKFHLKVLLDLQSYDEKTIQRWTDGLYSLCQRVLYIRDGIEKDALDINVYTDDVRVHRYGYTCDLDIFHASTLMHHGIKSKKTIVENVHVLHAWRSALPPSTFVQYYAGESSIHRAQLYVRWLDGETQAKVRPIDLSSIAVHWLEAQHLFPTWRALGLSTHVDVEPFCKLQLQVCSELPELW
jgi:hypothetical protein